MSQVYVNTLSYKYGKLSGIVSINGEKVVVEPFDDPNEFESNWNEEVKNRAIGQLAELRRMAVRVTLNQYSMVTSRSICMMMIIKKQQTERNLPVNGSSQDASGL